MRRLWSGFHIYLLGVIILTLGIALTIQSALGTSPFDALLVGLYRTFGLTIGSWEIVVGGTLIVANAILEKRRPEFLAFVTSLVTGIGIDSWLFVIDGWLIPGTWIGKFICLIVGIFFTALGVAIYLQSEIAPNPLDRTMLVIDQLTGWGITYARALINIILVIAAFLFGGAIGIGTLINALFSGMAIQYLLKYIKFSTKATAE